MQNSIIQGTYTNLRNIKKRNVVIIEIEIPREMAGDVVAKFGFPNQASPLPVAVAALKVEAIDAN